MARDPFDLYPGTATAGPVVIAVPHAGRDYPPLEGLLRVPLGRLGALEDRLADRLAETAIAAGVPAIVARTPRLWIDLNRAEDEIDTAMFTGPVAAAAPPSVRVRGGLGLIPRRLAGMPDLWRPLSAEDLAGRIAGHHRPYHAALAGLLARVRAVHGVALLIDLHSMPPLDGGTPQVVIGDRYGRSAAPQLADAAQAIATGAGFATTINAPYAGGHGLDRHARPDGGIHALQIEIDRRTYLDTALDRPGPGLARMQRFVAVLAARLGEMLVPPRAIAAE